MWQTLERKARFITQVMHGRLDTREIADIGDTALSFSEVKALATGNPLLMDKAEADAALARLQRAERAHRRNQDALRRALDHFEAEIARLTQLATTIDSAIKRRRDTHGDQFTMTVGGRRYDKRADAGQHLKQLAERELAALTGSLERSVSVGELGGFPVTVALDRSLGRTHVTFSLDGAPGASIELAAHDIRGADPVGLVTRLENRLSRLDERKATALADTDHARREVAHARDGIGQPFPHAAELATAHERARQIDEALERMARPDTEKPESTRLRRRGIGRSRGEHARYRRQRPGGCGSAGTGRCAGGRAPCRASRQHAPAARPPAGLDRRQAGVPPRRAATGDPDRGQAPSASAAPQRTNDTVPSQPDALLPVSGRADPKLRTARQRLTASTFWPAGRPWPPTRRTAPGISTRHASSSTRPRRSTHPAPTCGSSTARRSLPGSCSSPPEQHTPKGTTTGQRNLSATPGNSTPGCGHCGTRICPRPRQARARPAPVNGSPAGEQPGAGR